MEGSYMGLPLTFMIMNVVEEKSFPLYPSRFLAETATVIQDRLTREKQTSNNMYATCIHGR